MSATAQVSVHSSQFPAAVRLDLLESLRSRQVNHKFHYDSIKQAQKWLAVHQAYSPSRRDPNCEVVYQKGFEAVAHRLGGSRVHVIGLGCGGGQKDTALLKQLYDSGCAPSYTPCDVGVAMVLIARDSALQVVSDAHCFPVVCDLAVADDLEALFGASNEGIGSPNQATRLFTFFGMVPNFEPEIILPKLAQLVGPRDLLLLSANLAPGANYAAGVERVVPLYDNALTRDWLMTFLLDLGIENADGAIAFAIEEENALQLRRIVAHFRFTRDRTIQIDSHQFEFRASESIRLFFSYRHTPALVRSMLDAYGLGVKDQWISPSEEEGVFLVRRS